MEWDEALDFAADGLRRVRDDHGRDAVATYLGNPGAHTWSVLSFFALRLVLGTSNNSSATSTDQLPQHLTSAEMFGNLAMFPIPDVDRTAAHARAGRQPGGVQRLDHVGAGGARPPARDPRPRRHGRGGRPAPDRDRQAGHRARAGPSRRRPLPAPGHAQRAVRRGAGGPGRAGRAHRRPGPDPRAGGGVAARAVRRPGRRRGRDHRPDGARVRRRGDRRGLRPGGRLPAADGLDHALADQRPQRRDRQPGPPGRGHVHQPAGGPGAGAEAGVDGGGGGHAPHGATSASAACPT